MLDKDEILGIVINELSLSDSSSYNGVSQVNYEESLSYYLGRPNGTEVEGRSQVVSTDVADAIEWIMPQVMKSFTENNEVVIFDPVHEGDETQAELESEYVYEVLMKQNDGFIILHQFVKDALMQRNGILKVYYAKRNEMKTSEYTGINEDQLNMLLASDGVDLIMQSEEVDADLTMQKQQQMQMQMQQHMEQMQTPEFQQQMQDPEAAAQHEQMMAEMAAEMEKPVMVYDVKVAVERNRGQIYVDPVPPEEFRVNAQHNSLNLDSARFTAHVTMKTASDVMEEYGLTQEQAEDLPYGTDFYDREYRFALQNESIYYDHIETGDDSQRLTEISECFMQMDIEEDGIGKLVKVTVAGGDTPTELISVELIDSMPWVSTTTFLMSHKFQGISITDRLKQIQDQKTALWRNMFDNMYLQNNQRNVVVEGQVNMDDLLVSRPGGIIRAKRTDAIMPLATPQLGQDAYNMMEYLDRVRAGRTGVDADGNATPENIGDRVGSQGVDRLMNAKEQLVGLIIRVIAETGIKPLCTKIRDLSIKHVDAVVDFRFRGQWYQIQPSEWPDRTMCTVRVGTGTGDHNLMLQSLQSVLEVQKLLGEQGSVLIDEKRVYNTMDDFCKFAGLNGAVRYFVDPESPQGQQAAQAKQQQAQEEKEKQDQIEQIMVESQAKIADAEQKKVAAQQENGRLKALVDSTKNQGQMQIDMLEQRLNETQTLLEKLSNDEDRWLKKYEIDQRTAVELTRIEKDSKKDENDNFKKNQEDAAA